jgi:hypothetical protein
MQATRSYELLMTDEELSSSRRDWNEYPGQMRRGESPAEAPPAGSVFVKTGGNALQAIDQSILDHESEVRVIVPEGKGPGDKILVRCPYTKERFVPTTIPENAKAGTEFLVRIPPLQESNVVSCSDAAVVGLNVAGKMAAKSAIISSAAAAAMLL